MSEKPFGDLVEINLPSSAGSPLPEVGKPVVKVNGVEIENVTRIEIICDVEAITTVKLTFAARVIGAVRCDPVPGFETRTAPP